MFWAGEKSSIALGVKKPISPAISKPTDCTKRFSLLEDDEWTHLPLFLLLSRDHFQLMRCDVVPSAWTIKIGFTKENIIKKYSIVNCCSSFSWKPHVKANLFLLSPTSCVQLSNITLPIFLHTKEISLLTLEERKKCWKLCKGWRLHGEW